MRSQKFLAKVVLVIVSVLLFTTVVLADGGGLWLSGGQGRHNNRNQNTESKIGPDNVSNLAPLWSITTGDGPGGARDDVSATPAVDGEHVYFPDWSGNLFKADRRTGEVIWKYQISEYTGILNDFARTTPAIAGDLLIFGTQSGQLASAANVLAVDKNSGNLVWTTQADTYFGSIITQSATVFEGVAYVGVSSFEEFFAAVIPGYVCCQFRGSLMALDVDTGEILWKTYTTPEGYSGNAVWGSSPVVDTKRGSIYFSTGNNYSVPSDVLACIGGTDDPDEQRACLAPDNYFDAVVALDWQTGEVKWSTIAIPFDVWTVGCLDLGLPIPPQNCPDPEGPDFDFGQAPMLIKAGEGKNKQELLGVGQKSGQFWALKPDTGEIVWETQVSPGGVAGGMMWGSAFDGDHIYTSSANSERQSWNLIDGSVTNSGIWSALDPLTGEIVWQTAVPTPFAQAGGSVSSANGVVYACSQDAFGHMYALAADTGEILWSFASGGACNAGAAVVNGTVYWGSGYEGFGGTGNDQFYAFGLN